MDKECVLEKVLEKSDAKKEVLRYRMRIFSHVIKVLMFGRNCYPYEHWCNEISTWLTHIQSIRLSQNKTKNIKYEYLHEWFYDDLFKKNNYVQILEDVMYQEEEYNPIGFTELKKDQKSVMQIINNILIAISVNLYSKNKLKAELDQWINQHGIVESIGD